MKSDRYPTCALVVISHRTDGTLEQCLETLVACQQLSDWKLALVRQEPQSTPDPSCDAIAAIPWDAVVRLRAGTLSIEQLINRHRMVAYELGFEVLQADACLVLEDDVLLAPDALVFSKTMFLRYRNVRAFRAVNLGSLEVGPAALPNTYSLLRYGLHGQAALLPRGAYESRAFRAVTDWNHGGHWDALLDDFMKSGFVVTPNRSRYRDIGVVGSHMSADEDGAYFQGLEASYVGNDASSVTEYTREDLSHSWRRDVRVFRRRDSMRYAPILLHGYRSIRDMLPRRESH